MTSTVIVFIGAGIGGALRHGVNVGVARLPGAAFPFGTIIVNVAGSLAMGLLAAWLLARTGTAEQWRLFLGTGVLGGFTTFSAFSLDAALLIERNAYGLAAAYVLASVSLSIAALFAGLALYRIGA
ncbi:MAG: fluoride efflux transporter CrcB [Pseudomonadota bacterium]|nr:fluoride efflux transporter CrcB [Pseudomonadota bacterium]